MRPNRLSAVSIATIALVAVLPTSLFGQIAELTTEAPQSGSSSTRGVLVSSTSSASRILTFNLAVGDRHSIAISAEYLRLTSFNFELYGFRAQPDWKFSGVPLTVSFEHFLTDPSKRFVPVVGAGFSYYLSLVKTRHNGPSSNGLQPVLQSSKAMGMGWGAQATMGFRTRLYRTTFVQFQGRYRLVDGLAFMGSRSSEARFGHFDFAVGFGFSF
jgi:outer membrane protein W